MLKHMKVIEFVILIKFIILYFEKDQSSLKNWRTNVRSLSSPQSTTNLSFQFIFSKLYDNGNLVNLTKLESKYAGQWTDRRRSFTFDNSVEKEKIQTCCRAQYLASRYGQREHEAFSPLHIPQDPIGACSLSSTAPPINLLS